MEQNAAKLVPCPRCGKLARFTVENPWRPFCSERCKLIDLGHWASETYRVPEPGTTAGEAEPGDA